MRFRLGARPFFRRDVGPLLPGTEHVPPPGLAERFFGQDGRGHERLADYIDYVLEVLPRVVEEVTGGVMAMSHEH